MRRLEGSDGLLRTEQWTEESVPLQEGGVCGFCPHLRNSATPTHRGLLGRGRLPLPHVLCLGVVRAGSRGAGGTGLRQCLRPT